MKAGEIHDQGGKSGDEGWGMGDGIYRHDRL